MFKGRIKITGEIANFNTFKNKDGEIMVQKDGSLSFFRPEEVENVEQLGWHPASELPKLKDGEDDVDFIVIIYDEYGMLPFHATYCKYTGWSHDNVKWWCYPPNEEEQ